MDRPTPVGGVCFSPDGKYMATRSDRAVVRLWRLDDGSCVAVFSEHDMSINHITFTPDSEFLASGDWGGKVHIRRLSDFI